MNPVKIHHRPDPIRKLGPGVQGELSPHAETDRAHFLGSDLGPVEQGIGGAPQIGCRMILTQGDTVTELPIPARTTFAWQFDHVMDVLERGAMPLTGGADAIATMAAIDAIKAAATVMA